MESNENKLLNETTIENGKFQFADGSIYEGEYKKEENGILQRHGNGIQIRVNEKYKGEWKNDQIHGKGEYIFATGAQYTGNFVNGMFHGEGKYQWNDGACYEGMWENNKMHGKGCYIDKNGAKWEGNFVNGKYDTGNFFQTLR